MKNCCLRSQIRLPLPILAAANELPKRKIPSQLHLIFNLKMASFISVRQVLDLNEITLNAMYTAVYPEADVD